MVRKLKMLNPPEINSFRDFLENVAVKEKLKFAAWAFFYGLSAMLGMGTAICILAFLVDFVPKVFGLFASTYFG